MPAPRDEGLVNIDYLDDQGQHLCCERAALSYQEWEVSPVRGRCGAVRGGAGRRERLWPCAGGGEREGRRLIDSFLKNTPALQKLKDKVSRLAEKEWLPALDGRRLIVRSQHAALNTLLQGAGAIVMKQALIMLNRKIIHANMDARFVANVHDEWQIETTEKEAETVGYFAVQSIRQAGIRLKLRCPLDGEFKVGLNWAATH